MFFFATFEFNNGKESFLSTTKILIAAGFYFLCEIIKNKMAITKNHFLSTHHIMSMILQINELVIQLIKILLQILM